MSAESSSKDLLTLSSIIMMILSLRLDPESSLKKIWVELEALSSINWSVCHTHKPRGTAWAAAGLGHLGPNDDFGPRALLKFNELPVRVALVAKKHKKSPPH